MPTNTTRLGLQEPVGSDGVPELRIAIGANASTLDSAALDMQGLLSARPAAGLSGRYYWATDALELFRDNGSAWTPIFPSVNTMVHSWTMDDQTSPNPSASVIGSWFSPTSSETIIGAIIHCVTSGSTPSTFAIQTDHGTGGTNHTSPGTLSTITGLGSLTPTTTQQLVSITPYALSTLDRVAVVCTNPSTGNSLGCTITTLSLPA